ncbi:MAG: hypothetical protein KGH85_07575 [Thaumarchaeota archaeon]|nr:hypothetical protein [Nitrososphaerota archaeon]
MLRDYAIITLGVLTLLATSAAVYGILTINTQIQAKPEQIKIPDYTTELDSLKSQVDSIDSQVNSINSQINTMNTNLAILDTLKNRVADINGKLSNLAINSTTIQQSSLPVSPTYASLAVVLDKSNYLQTDAIQITAIGANPQKTVDVELLDSTGFVVLHKTTWSDSSGKVSYQMQLSTALPLGNYQVQVISDQHIISQSLAIVAPSTTTSTTTTTTTSSDVFTAQTDKAVYNTGDFIQVSGAGQASSSITGVLTSPSGKTYSTATTIQSDGSYVMFFSPSQPYETGNWNIVITNLGQSKSLGIYVGTGSSSSTSVTFTAQTDKSIYQKGDLIQATGTGQPNTTVSGILTSPSGLTHTTTTTTNSDGTYTLFFSIDQSYETGNWVVTISNLSQSKTLSIYIQS